MKKILLLDSNNGHQTDPVSAVMKEYALRLHEQKYFVYSNSIGIFCFLKVVLRFFFRQKKTQTHYHIYTLYFKIVGSRE